MPVVISPKRQHVPNPDGSTSPNPQDRVAQLEAELSSAGSEIRKLTETNKELQTRIEYMAAQKETLQTTHENELQQRDAKFAQYDAKFTAFKKQHEAFVSKIEHRDRYRWILRACIVAALLVTTFGFGLYSYWPKETEPSKKTEPGKETTTYHVEMNPSTFQEFFPDYIGPSHYCGRNISVLGKIGKENARTPTIDCTEKGLPTSDAKGCKDVTQCSILIHGTYPNGPYDVVDTQNRICTLGHDECTIRTLRTRDAEKE